MKTTEKIESAVISIGGGLSELAKVTVRREDGRVNSYNVHIGKLATMLSEGIVTEETLAYEELGVLPQGYLNCKYADNRNFAVACLLPGTVRPYIYHVNGERAFLLPFPTLLFLFNIVDGKVNRDSSQRCYAVNEQGMTCRFPFPNVYEDGHICWGGNQLPEISSLAGVNQLMELFLNSGFNTHLYSESNTTLGMAHIESLIRHLEVMDTFPTEILIPHGISVQDMVRDYLKKVGV